MSKTIKDEQDDRWRKKGHAHPLAEYMPVPCPDCGGWGKFWEGGMSLNPEIDNAVECKRCEGTGEIWP